LEYYVSHTWVLLNIINIMYDIGLANSLRKRKRNETRDKGLYIYSARKESIIDSDIGNDVMT